MEAYTADHPQINIDELLYDWPASKFEAFYSAYAKRKIADELAQRRTAESAAVWGNMNYDSKEEPEIRSKLQELIDERYSKAIGRLYGDSFEDDEVELDEDDPFFKAIKAGQERYQIEESDNGAE